MRKIVLASASPRRKELLEQAGAVFSIVPAKGEEVVTKEKPDEVVMELALQKAKEVSGQVQEPECIIIGADTVVVYQDRILGKPKNEEDAEKMLTLLAGNTHSVYTGVAIIEKNGAEEKIYNFFEETRVSMYPMSKEEIRAYIATKEPMDKAGAYGIQGRCAIYIEKILGDYNNVVGLPIARIYQEMKKIGIEIYGNS